MMDIMWLIWTIGISANDVIWGLRGALQKHVKEKGLCSLWRCVLLKSGAWVTAGSSRYHTYLIKRGDSLYILCDLQDLSRTGSVSSIGTAISTGNAESHEAGTAVWIATIAALLSVTFGFWPLVLHYWGLSALWFNLCLFLRKKNMSESF